MSYRGITYRLIPGTKARARQLACLAGACRYVWNHFLGENQRLIAVHREDPENHPKPPTSFFSLGKEFTQLRLSTPWLQELSFLVVRHTLKYQADAWAQYFKGVRGRPKFKGKRGDDSFTIPENVKLRSNHVHIPRIGWLVVRGNNPYPQGKPISATVRQCGRKWFCSVIYEVDLPEPVDNGLAVGLDRNVGQVATSTGDIIPLPDTKSLETRKKHYQRMVSRRKKGSNRRKRANQLWARTARKIANQRQDWCHQISRVLAQSASEIIIEDLNTQSMTKSAKGTVENPGKNVKQKSGLNREILRSGWGILENFLGYKAHTVTRVPAAHTSQKCSQCGYIAKENRKTQSKFECVRCGHIGNADINAALNILASGTGASGRGKTNDLLVISWSVNT
ncbi:MAG: transposase [Gammaproteobacteria bacterium]|nr:transposase [Gammaproteobacteria bacterium]